MLEQTRPTGHGRARGLVSSRASGDRIQASTYAPSQGLSPFVATYWAGHWDLRGQDPHTTELLGDPCLHIVFESGDRGSESRIVGVCTRLWTRTLEGQGRVRGIKLRLGAARALLPRPIHEFTDRITALETVFPDGTRALEQGVCDLQSDQQVFAFLGDWLGEYARMTPQVRGAIEIADQAVSDSEITKVEELAAASGRTVRGLQRLFREYVGVSPKWVIRRNRLQEVALRMERGDVPSVAGLAADLGYADQAHLARDFKSAVGKNLTEFSKSVR